METGIIYARYSSSAQREVSIEQQIKVCEDYAARMGIEIVGIYQDRAKSGTSDRRPDFQRMVQDAQKSTWSYVIVYALDRFARDRYDSATYKRKLKDAGVRVLSATEALSDDPSSIVVESFLEGFAEYYSRKLAQDVTRGMRDNAEKCLVNGPLPPGYDKGPDGRYSINEREASAVREIFDRTLAHETPTDIAQDLNKRGVTAKKGKPWTISMIYRVLENERYAGTYIYSDIRIEGGIPAIISRETFNAVQIVIGTKKNPHKTKSVPQRRRQTNGMYLLTGKLFCGLCKAPMVGVSGHGRNGDLHYYYACKSRRTTHSCDKKAVRRDQLEYNIAAALKAEVLTDETIEALADAVEQKQRSSNVYLELESTTAALAEAKKAHGNIMSAIENGLFTPGMQKRLMDLETEQAQLEEKIMKLKEKQSTFIRRQDIADILYMFREGDPEDKDFQQALFDSFLVRAYLYEDGSTKAVFRITPDKTKEYDIPTDFDIDGILPDDIDVGSYKDHTGSPIGTIRTKYAKIVLIDDLFAMRLGYVGREIPS